MPDHASRTGVRIAADFRDNLIIDRYDPVFASLHASKRRHLRSANSEDAVAWNVFRSLRQIAPTVWLPDLFAAAFPGHALTHTEHATVELWKTVEPPPMLLDADDGEAEIDVVIQTPSIVWFIEAKLGTDVSTRTTTRSARDQVLRTIDVGSFHAGTRQFYFSLFVGDPQRSRDVAAAVDAYRDLAKPREALASHRPDRLANLAGVSRLAWTEVGEVLADAAADAARAEERQYAQRALEWLRGRGLARAAS